MSTEVLCEPHVAEEAETHSFIETAAPVLQIAPPASAPESPRRVAESFDGGWRLFQDRLERYAARCAVLWKAAEPVTPDLGRPTTASDKLRRERKTEECLEEVKRRLRRYPRSTEARGVWCRDFLKAAREMASGCLGFPDAGLKLLFTEPALEATRRFVREARAFDPSLSEESLLQALRNLWVVHSIQLMVGKEISLSPASFGYSMLYPWTDNYLDGCDVPGLSKADFGKWLDQRLCDSQTVARDSHTAQVGRLVGLIEGRFPREEFEEVYLSLRGIHWAQMASLSLQQAGDIPDEETVLGITVRKGGASVLADAYLVGGKLSEAEASFMFGYGVLLQLLDDLQDVQSDLADGHTTLFARPAAGGFLDEVTSKLWSFMRAVLSHPTGSGANHFGPINAMIQESCKLLLLRAVARNHGFYTAGFVSEMETLSPFRFGFLRDREETLAGECKEILARLQRQECVSSVVCFPIPGS